MPRFVSEEDVENLKKPVTLQEIDIVLKWFEKDKNRRQDGWPIEFYLTISYHIGKYILMEIEDCKLSEDAQGV